MLSQRSLEAFHQVMRFGSIAAAASELNISQPAISRHVRDLEAATGLQLFTRMGNRLHPTRQAFGLLAEVERSFVGLREIEGQIDRIASGAAEKITIAGMPILAMTIIPRTVAELVPTFPQHSIELQSARSSNILPRVMGGLYSLGAVALRRADTGLNVVWRQEFRYACIIPPEHPFAEKPFMLPSDLEGADFVGYADTTVTGPQFDRLFAVMERPPIIRVRVHMSESASILVMRGLGVAVVDPFMARAHEERGGLSRPFISSARFDICLVTQPGRPLPDFVRAFIEIFDKQARSYYAPPTETAKG